MYGLKNRTRQSFFRHDLYNFPKLGNTNLFGDI